jgi:hypothetical protein
MQPCAAGFGKMPPMTENPDDPETADEAGVLDGPATNPPLRPAVEPPKTDQEGEYPAYAQGPAQALPAPSEDDEPEAS